MTTLTTPADWKDVLATRNARRAANVLRLHPSVEKTAALLDAPAGPTSIDEVRRCATFVISTPTPDRSEDVVSPRGVKLANYARNPVVYFDHGFSGIHVPIGKCEDEFGNLAIVVTEEGIEGTCYFADSVEGGQIFELVKQAVLRAASINLQPIMYTIRSADTATGRPGMDIEEWELLEWSIVGIPDNPEAIRKILAGGHLAGSPICEPIKKSLAQFAPKPKLMGRKSSMSGLIYKDGDDSETDSGMELSADVSIAGNPGMEESDGAVGGDMEDGIKPHGARALEECRAHLKSAHTVLNRHAAVVEHPKVRKCLEKACDEVKGSLADIEDCYRANYGQLGEASLKDDDVMPDLASKSAVRRLLGQLSTVRELQAQFAARTKAIRRLPAEDQSRAIVELETAFCQRLSRLFKSLESIHHDASLTAIDDPLSVEAVLGEVGRLVQTQIRVQDTLGSIITDLANSIPRKRTA
jgi:Caudovirus prohead serine protease